MTLKEFTEFINILKDIDKNIDDMVNIGFDIDGKIIQSCFEIKSKSIQFLNKLWGSNYDDIGWFIYENDYGRKHFDITLSKPVKKHFKISSVKDMYDYLTYCKNIKDKK